MTNPQIMSVVASKYDDIFEIFAGSYVETMSCPLIVVDDGLTDVVKTKHRNFQYIPSPKPFHWSKSINAGIRLAGDADVIIFNDDCFIYTQGLDQVLQAVAYSSEDIGASSALRNDQIDRSLADERMIDDYELYLQHVAANRHLCSFVDEIPYVFNERPILTAAYIKRSVLDIVGLLDEFFLLNREDVDWGYRMARAGYLSALAYGAFVEHGGDHFNFDQSNSRRRAGNTGTRPIDAEYFDTKWDKIKRGIIVLPVREGRQER